LDTPHTGGTKRERGYEEQTHIPTGLPWMMMMMMMATRIAITTIT